MIKMAALCFGGAVSAKKGMEKRKKEREREREFLLCP